MQEKHLSEHEKTSFEKALGYIHGFCQDHPCTVGGLEIAAGTALIAIGVKTGSIAMGNEVLGVDMGQFNLASLAGGAGGALLGTAAGVLGAVGIAAGGAAIGIPAAALAAVGGVVGGIAGYAGGDILHKFLNPGFDVIQMFGAGSLLALGTALIIDGCKRILGSETFGQILSAFRDGVLYLVEITKQVVARTMDEAANFWRNLTSAPTSVQDTAGSAVSSVAVAAGGAAVGSAVAAATVTVLGSHALGGAALALGLVSAPVWPVVAGVAGGAAVGYAAWKGVKTAFGWR